MAILILGSSGMLGNTLYKYLSKQNHNIYSISRNTIDFSDYKLSELEHNLSTIIKQYDIKVLLNCIGLIKQRPNIKSEDMIMINSVLPNRLATFCNNQAINMIHFTTDCVYTGETGGYDEDSVHDARDIYGLSKSLGENNLCTVIRSSIIGEEIHNKLSLVEWVKSKKNLSINGFSNHFWNGVTCLQMGKIINEMIQKQSFWLGVRHLYSNIVNKYELVNMINNIYDLNINIKPTNDSKSIDRTLTSKYPLIFDIPNLYKQISEMKDFAYDQ